MLIIFSFDKQNIFLNIIFKHFASKLNEYLLNQAIYFLPLELDF